MAITVTAINGMGKVTETGTISTTTGMEDSDIMHIANDYIDNSGVHAREAGECLITQSAPADDNVNMAAGTAYVSNSTYAKNAGIIKFWRVENDASTAVQIPANTSGNPRIDKICIKVDTVTAPNDDASNVATLVVVQGTPAGSPTPPATPPDHLALAEVNVADSFVSISNANITDTRTIVNWILPNEAEIRGRNNADSANLELLQVDSGDNVRLGDANANLVRIRNKRIQMLNFGGSAVELAQYDAGGKLIINDSASNLQIDGELVNALRFENNVKITSRDAGDTADKDVLFLDNNDNVQVGASIGDFQTYIRSGNVLASGGVRTTNIRNLTGTQTIVSNDITIRGREDVSFFNPGAAQYDHVMTLPVTMDNANYMIVLTPYRIAGGSDVNIYLKVHVGINSKTTSDVTIRVRKADGTNFGVGEATFGVEYIIIGQYA